MRKRFGIWFRFNGLTCMEAGAWLRSAPAFVHPAWRGESLTAVGRDGDIFASEEAEDTIDVKMKIATHMSNRERVTAWLRGSGLLSFSWQLDRACMARVEKSFTWKFVTPGRDPVVETEVAFVCQPWQYMQPEPDAIEITHNGTELYNPGTLAAKPIIKINGTGSFTVAIGAQSVYFQNITDGIVVNSELGDAYDLNETVLLNNKVMGDLFEIQPGHNMVSWALEDASSITSIEILPRWRFRQ